MWSVIHYISKSRPAGGCLENVTGLQLHAPQELSPLAVIEAELQKMGYAVAAIQMNVSSFHQVVRERTLGFAEVRE